MKERPILFNTAMVQAILAGRKTQTRRVCMPRKDINIGCMLQPNELAGEINWGTFDNSAFGRPGDRLWVRETFQGPLINQGGDYPDGYEKPEFCVYAADGVPRPEFTTIDDETVCRWRPSIHMPRWACRIILEITNVRVERLHNITDTDCKAEGYPAEREADGGSSDAWLWFRDLWGKTGGDWKANPWVWVVEFKVLTTNGKVPEVAA
ncbi:hypothetical protein [Rheinheimera fenheensis]|uniref:hypothetical protein n=1 Tax=Rheinheimera fenheensis TaxID=3152295 RepID=UPI0032610897